MTAKFLRSRWLTSESTSPVDQFWLWLTCKCFNNRFRGAERPVSLKWTKLSYFGLRNWRWRLNCYLGCHKCAVVWDKPPLWCQAPLQPVPAEQATVSCGFWAAHTSCLPRRNLKRCLDSCHAGTSIPRHRKASTAGGTGRLINLMTLMALCKCHFPFTGLQGLKMVPFLSFFLPLSLSLSDGDFADNCKETASFNTPHLSRGVWLCRPFWVAVTFQVWRSRFCFALELAQKWHFGVFLLFILTSFRAQSTWQHKQLGR